MALWDHLPIVAGVQFLRDAELVAEIEDSSGSETHTVGDLIIIYVVLWLWLCVLIARRCSSWSLDMFEQSSRSGLVGAPRAKRSNSGPKTSRVDQAKHDDMEFLYST